MALPKLDVPTYELTLPSSNKSIVYRPFLVKEHKILMTLKNSDDKEVFRVIKELVDVCTFKSLNIEELANFDIEYIFIQLRAKSIGETLDLLVNCECGNKINYKANLLDAKVIKKGNHTNKIKLTKSIGVEMRYPSYDEVIKAYENNNQEDIIRLVISCIKGIYDNINYWLSSEQSEDEILEFVNDLTNKQFELIEDFFTTMPKLELTIETKCDKCGKEHKVKLGGLQSFFI